MLEAAANKEKTYVAGKPEIEHLYDVGRNIHTEFDPKNHREQYYTMKHGFYHDKRMGSFRTASAHYALTYASMTSAQSYAACRSTPTRRGRGC